MNKNDKNFMVNNIRAQYLPRQNGKLEELSELDKRVKRPANIFAYIFGSIGAIIMGMGMSLIMTDLGAKIGITATMAVGIPVGAVGLLMASLTYPIFRRIISSRRAKYADRIIALSDELMAEQ